MERPAVAGNPPRFHPAQVNRPLTGVGCQVIFVLMVSNLGGNIPLANSANLAVAVA